MTDEELKTQSSEETLVGHSNGDVLPDGDKIVYDYDDSGAFIGWHKENSSPHPVDNATGEDQEIIPDPNSLKEEAANG